LHAFKVKSINLLRNSVKSERLARYVCFSACVVLTAMMRADLQAYPDVQIKFVEGADTITVEGPKDSVFAVQKLLTETALTLVR
jgi:hypothetical protein